jgi:hypothetical protein
MNASKTLTTRLQISVLSVLAIVIQAAAGDGRVSPRETTSAEIAGSKITVTYGRPNIKHPTTGQVRKIWGGLVPWGKIWRTGADDATVFTTTKALRISDTVLPAGKYSLFTLPVEKGVSKIVFNKWTGQMGTQYDPEKDILRADLTRTELPATVERFTISLTPGASNNGALNLAWENLQFSLDLTVEP